MKINNLGLFLASCSVAVPIPIVGGFLLDKYSSMGDSVIPWVALCWLVGMIGIFVSIVRWAIWHFAPLTHARHQMYYEMRERYERDKAAGRVGPPSKWRKP
jgi:hypothetical protein